MFNKTVMIGNLTREPELKYLVSGTATCTLGIASNRRFKKTDGSQGEEVCFIDAVLFGRSAEIANQYLRKGKRVLIEGRIKLDTWTDQNGQKRSKHSIVCEAMTMLDKDASTEQPKPDYVTEGGIPVTVHPAEENVPSSAFEINDSEIPF